MVSGEEIKKIIRASDFNQAQIADFIGVTRVHLNRMLGYATFPEEYAKKIYDVTKSNYTPPPPGGNVALHSNGLDAGNHITMNDNPDFIEGYFTIKGLPANDGAWLVNGHSMYPTISKGSRVILKKLENIDLIVFGEIYAVDLREHGGKIKRIKKGSDAEHWLLVSDNKDYEPFEVNVKHDVLAVFRVICVVECF